MTWIWYPTEQNDTAPVDYFPKNWMKAEKGDFISSLFRHAPETVITHSTEQASVAGSKPFQVLIFQPGFGQTPGNYTVIAENLASHGYIVVGSAPTYSSNLVVFSDGRVVRTNEEAKIPDDPFSEQGMEKTTDLLSIWSNDVIFSMDKLTEVNADPASPFYKKIDLDHIGVFGHSFGGASALMTCQTDSRCKSALDIDGTPFKNIDGNNISQPVMFLNSDLATCDEACKTGHEEIRHQVYEDLKGRGYYVTVTGASHYNFSDLSLLLNPIVKAFGVLGSIESRRGLMVTTNLATSFFDEYLKDKPHSLENELDLHKDILSIEKK